MFQKHSKTTYLPILKYHKVRLLDSKAPKKNQIENPQGNQTVRPLNQIVHLRLGNVQEESFTTSEKGMSQLWALETDDA